MSRPLTVVIPTHNRPGLLQECLRHLLRQASLESVKEIIVVDDGSTPETAEVVQSLEFGQRLQLLRNEVPRGPAAARNRGIRAATTPATLLLDDDVWLEPTALQQLQVEGLPEAGDNFSLLGHVSWHPTLTINSFMFWQENGGAQFAYSEIGGSRRAGWRFYGTSMIVSPTDLLQRELFDENFPIPRYEDMELGYRLQKEHRHWIQYVPAARGHHLHSTCLVEWLEKVPRFAAPAVYFARKSGAEVAGAIGVDAARELESFRWDDLQEAASIIGGLSNALHSPPNQSTIFGDVWRWERLAGAYRMIQNFFHLTAIRQELQLPSLMGTDFNIRASQASEILLRQFREQRIYSTSPIPAGLSNEATTCHLS